MLQNSVGQWNTKRAEQKRTMRMEARKPNLHLKNMWLRGKACSADGLRFKKPIEIEHLVDTSDEPPP